MGFRTVYRNDRMPEAGLQVRAMLGSPAAMIQHRILREIPESREWPTHQASPGECSWGCSEVMSASIGLHVGLARPPIHGDLKDARGSNPAGAWRFRELRS